jgi:hypothetical protein
MRLTLPALNDAGRRLWGSDRIADLYPAYLFVTHGIIRASVPLMEVARDRARSLGAEGDPVALGVAAYLADHVEEERDHDAWLLDDITELGWDRDSLLRRPPPPSVAAFVGAQYYWALHHHPVTIMGYIALLEGYPIEADEIIRVQQRTGYPASAFRTLLKHGQLDPHHAAEFDAALDRLPLAEPHRAAVGLSALASIRMMTSVIEDLLEQR